MTTQCSPVYSSGAYSQPDIASDNDNNKPKTRRKRKPKPSAAKSSLTRPLIRFFCNDCQHKFRSRILANRNNNAVQHYCSLYEKIITRKVGAHSNKCQASHGVGPCVVKRTEPDPDSDGEDETKLAYFASKGGKGTKRTGSYSRNPRPSKKHKTSASNGADEPLPPYVSTYAAVDAMDALPPIVHVEPHYHHHHNGYHHQHLSVDEPPMDGHHNHESSLPPMPVLMQIMTSAVDSPPPPPPPPLEEFEAPPLEAPVEYEYDECEYNEQEAEMSDAPPEAVNTSSDNDDHKTDYPDHANVNNAEASVEVEHVTNGGVNPHTSTKERRDEDDDLGIDLSVPALASPSKWVKCTENGEKKEQLAESY